LGYVTAGYTASYGSLEQVYLVKTDAAGSVGVKQAPKAEVRSPNGGPTVVRGVLFMEASGEKREARSELLDISGCKVLDLAPGANDVSRLAPGVYFVRTVSRGLSAVTKVIVSR
jgi:hypothetical protein